MSKLTIFVVSVGLAIGTVRFLGAEYTTEVQMPTLQVTVVSQDFHIYDPVEIQIKIVNNTSRSAWLVSHIHERPDLILWVVRGKNNGIQIVPPPPKPSSGLSTSAKIDAGKVWQINYPLYEWIRLNDTGEYQISYKLEMEIWNERLTNNLPVSVRASGTFPLTVRPRSETDIRSLLADIASQLEDPTKRPAAIRGLLYVSHPLAIETLKQAWPMASVEESEDFVAGQVWPTVACDQRKGIIDALIRIGTQDAFKTANNLSRSSNLLDIERYLTSRLCPVAEDPVTHQYAIEFWKQGLESKFAKIRAQSIYCLAEFAKNEANEEIRRRLNDESEDVKRAAEYVLGKKAFSGSSEFPPQ